MATPIKDQDDAILARNDLTQAQRILLRRRLKRDAHLAAMPQLPYTITRGNFEITIKSAKQGIDDGFLLDVSVKRDGALLDLGPANPFWFGGARTPILVDDPDGEVIRGDGSLENPIRTLREDPWAALRFQFLHSLSLVVR